MFGRSELKEKLIVVDGMVECPVRGCTHKVPKMRRDTVNLGSPKEQLGEFFCPTHNIYISPTTFEYANEADNLLWKSSEDLKLLEAIRKVKRENRMARDNSEDAVTWNVFRGLERSRLVDAVIGQEVTGQQLTGAAVIYWSFNSADDGGWKQLNEARQEFGESSERGSEPDVIILTSNSLLFIEAKLTANNETVPSDKSSSKRYETGGDKWFSQVFQSDYRTIAIDRRRYELMRFWLIGTWIASRLNLDFYLVNLVRAAKEQDIKGSFERHLKQIPRTQFLRVAWEDVFATLAKANAPSDTLSTMTSYFKNKTIGYDKFGKLQMAFEVD